MKFLLQSDAKDMQVEIAIVKDLLSGLKFQHQYTEMPLFTMSDLHVFQDYIPIGTIQFVEAWLKQYRNIDKIYPIEIPKFLRTAKYLKREYRILPYGAVPREGKWFVKDATDLKSFSFSGNVEHMWNSDDIVLRPDHFFQVSSVQDVLSEYRIYFIDGEIENVCNYDGMPWIFPDMDLVGEINAVYSVNKEYPKSYTMDMMVSKEGTSLIEIHPFAAVGLYSTLWGGNLLDAYRDGIRYIERYNHQVEL